MSKKISIIIPSYQSLKTIEKTLSSLKQHSNFNEVIVVDSTPDLSVQNQLKHLIDEYGASVVLLDEPTPPGRARASSDTLLFLDADVVIDSNFESEWRIAIDKGINVAGGSVAVPHFQELKPIALAQYFIQFSEFMPSGGIRSSWFVPSCNLMCQKKLFDALGGFPSIRAAEDVLFGLEANKRDKMMFVPQAKVFHVFRENITDFLGNQFLLGSYVYIYRRALSNSVLYQPLLVVLMLPLLVPIKILRISKRVLQYGTHKLLLKYLLVLPVTTLGLCAWSVGYLKAALLRR